MGAGILLGLSVALPFGPVSLLCVQRSIDRGYRYGLATGVGAASAQGIFAAAVLAGQDAISSQVLPWSGVLRWVSAGLLLWMGVRALTRRSRPGEARMTGGMGATCLSSLLLGLTNPMTILPYLAVASGAVASGAVASGAMAAGTGAQMVSPWSVPGVVAGAAAWYAVVSGGALVFRGDLLGRCRRHLNAVSGGVLIVFGFWMAAR